MKRTALLVAGVLVVATTGTIMRPAGVAQARGVSTVPSAPATLGPLVSGSTGYVGGTLVYTGYPYKDTGASTDGTSGGAATYPASVPRGNGANLIQLQVSVTSGGDMTVRAVLETLLKPDIPLLGVGFDSDGSAGTGAAGVPGGRWPASRPLGLDVFAAVSSADTTVMRWSGGAWSTVAHLPATVDTSAHTMTAELPARVLPAQTNAWKAVGVLGLAVPGSSWLDGSGPIYDLAFVHAEDPANDSGALMSAEQVAITGKGHTTGAQWQDKLQAGILHGTADAGAAVGTLDFATMRAHTTTTPDVLAPGYHTWTYHSGAQLGDGIVDGTAAGGLWAGPYQPYLVQVPSHLSGRVPLIVYLHGGGGNHLDNGTFAPQGPLDQGSAIVVYPFGREFTTAQDHGYQGAGEMDVLDVIADVQRHYPVDSGRILVAGTSTGGGGAFRFAQLDPDLFAGVLVLSAYDDTHLEENTVDLPVRLVNGAADPAASQVVLLNTTQELDRLGDVDYRSWSALAHSHADPQAPLTECVLGQLAATQAVTNPARVVYGIDPANEVYDSTAHLDVRHTHAYWVSGITTRPGLQPNDPLTRGNDTPGTGNAVVARIDAVSLANPSRALVSTAVDGAGQNITQAGDYCGGAASQSNDVWRVHGVALSPGASQPTSNGLAVSVVKLAAAGFDLNRAGVDATRPVTLSIDGDGQIAITLSGTWPGGVVHITRDSRPWTTAEVRGGRVVFSDAIEGHHTYVVSP
ncbi:MAG TPA: hypothetical protein VGQ42_17340 [Candidatus Dormibacteraeota bacterium]|jgi:predicted esterase|nr:hypothetical protein [Candidatus Dormibacteraeota bacterium]